jgi:hypothetical protein
MEWKIYSSRVSFVDRSLFSLDEVSCSSLVDCVFLVKVIRDFVFDCNCRLGNGFCFVFVSSLVYLRDGIWVCD